MTSLTEAAGWERFQVQRVAVLGTADAGGVPHLVPVTFAVAARCIFFAVDFKPKRTTALRRLENIARNPSVSFLAHGYEEDWNQLWWARVDAQARIVPAGHPDGGALDALAQKYPQYVRRRPEGAVVIADVTSVVGWQAAPPAPDLGKSQSG